MVSLVRLSSKLERCSACDRMLIHKIVNVSYPNGALTYWFRLESRTKHRESQPSADKSIQRAKV